MVGATALSRHEPHCTRDAKRSEKIARTHRLLSLCPLVVSLRTQRAQQAQSGECQERASETGRFVLTIGQSIPQGDLNGLHPRNEEHQQELW